MDVSATPGAFGTIDPLFLLLAALALEAYLGGPWVRESRYLQPRRPVADLVAALDSRLNRPERGTPALLFRGAVLAVVLSILALLLGAALQWLLLNYPFAWILELFLLALLITQRAPCMQASQVSVALDKGGLVAAQEALRPLLQGRMAPDVLARLDRPGTAAAAIDGLARRFAFDVVAPVFWFALLELPGLFLQQAIRTAAGALARRDDDFSLTVLRLDRALTLLPTALASALLVAAAVFVPTSHPKAALRRAWRGRGHVAAAMGGALFPEGDRQAPRDIGSRHIERAIALFAVGCLINAGWIAALAWLRTLL